MSAAVIFVIVGSLAALPAAPQRSLAAGTYPQLAKVMIAADTCGFHEFRTEADQGGFKLLFLNDDSGSYACIEQWLSRNARELKLVPRFIGDDYSH